jgi:hypothetical protein
MTTIRVIPPNAGPVRTVEVAPLEWKRDRDGYWSACGRYHIDKTPSTAIGPWLVLHDPEGKEAGWGDLLWQHTDTMREAKLKAAAHAAGVSVEKFDRVEVAT